MWGTMANEDWYSQDEINARAGERQRENFRDLQDEIAGRDTGKMARFLSDEDRERRTGIAADKHHAALRTALEIALMDQAYQALYDGTLTALNDTETVVYSALVESADQVADTERQLQEAEERKAQAEEIERLRQETLEAQKRHEQLLEHEARLQEIRARMEDEDEPPSEEELEDFQQEISRIRTDADISLENKTKLDAAPVEKAAAPDLDLSGFTPS